MGREVRESENFPSPVSKWGPRGGGWHIYKLVLVPTDPIFRGFFLLSSMKDNPASPPEICSTFS